MKVRILREKVTVYLDMDSTAPALTELVAGNEVELGKTTKKLGVQWVEVILPNGQRGFIVADEMQRVRGRMLKMFKGSDYIPFMLGVFIIGGLLAVPFLWGLEVGYFVVLPWSLGSCTVLLLSIRRNGTVSWIRATLAIVAIVIVAQAYTGSTGARLATPGGVLGFPVLMGCGLIGIGIGRLVRRRER